MTERNILRSISGFQPKSVDSQRRIIIGHASVSRILNHNKLDLTEADLVTPADLSKLEGKG
jgi:hypothetical protein